MRIPLLILLVPAMLLCKADKALGMYPWDLLPADNEIAGWTEDSLDTLVKIPAPSDLYNVIDGGAPLYLDHGFVQGAHKGYANAGRTVQVKIYDMGRGDSALALYCDPTLKNSCSLIDTIGDTACVEEFLVVQSIHSVQGIYYVYVSVPKDSAGLVSGFAFARCIVGKIVSTGVITVDDKTPGVGMQKLVCSPNPATGAVTIWVSRATGAYNNLRVFDVRGNMLSEIKKNNSNPFIWNTKMYPAGMYLIEISGHSKKLSARIDLLK